MTASTRIHTKLLTSSFTFLDSMKIMSVSILVISGGCTIIGNMQYAGGDANETITLPVGATLTLTDSGGAPLNGITLDATGGSAALIFGF